MTIGPGDAFQKLEVLLSMPANTAPYLIKERRIKMPVNPALTPHGLGCTDATLRAIGEYYAKNGTPREITFGPYSHEFCEIVIILADRALHVTSHESRPEPEVCDDRAESRVTRSYGPGGPAHRAGWLRAH